MALRTSTDFVEQSGLRPVGELPSVASYLKEMWRRRAFLWEVPLGDLRSHNMDTVLGNVWHLLNPLLLLLVYYIIFGLLIPDVRAGMDNFLAFLAIGIFLFQYSRKCFTQGAKTIISNEGLIRTLNFPRGILPASAVISQTLAFSPSLVVMFGFAVITGEPIRPSWILAIPLILLFFMFNLGAAFILARATSSFRDIENLLPFVFRLLFYASGVPIPLHHLVPEEWAPLLLLNPIYSFLTIARGLLLDTPFGTIELLSAATWTFTLLVLGFFFFYRGELQYGRS